MSEVVTPKQLADIGRFSGLPSDLRAQVALYLLFDGDVIVHRSGHHVADLHAGDVFGEAGTLSLEHRNATVIATTPARLGVLMGWELRDLAAGSPELAARVEDLIASRTSQD